MVTSTLTIPIQTVIVIPGPGFFAVVVLTVLQTHPTLERASRASV